MPASTQPVTKRYYPALSDVITVDDLPEFLSFAEEGLNGLLSNIHYKNLQFTKSYRGDSAFYSLEIVTGNIGINLPFGFRFILNPDVEGNANLSSFPITLEYEWQILAFLRSFNLRQFAFTPLAFYELGLQVFRISEDEVLAHVLNYFVTPQIPGQDKFQQVVADLNQQYPGANLILPPDTEPSLDALISQIRSNAAIPDGVSAALFFTYLDNGDDTETKTRLQQFYNRVIPEGIEAYLKRIIVPRAKASLQLSAALEFPATVLQPVDINGQPQPGKTRFTFAEATLYADTEGNIGYEAEVSGSLSPQFNQIGNTGLIIEFDSAKLDMSRTTNIPEADAAGYPSDFTGLYIRQASVRLSRLGTDSNTGQSAALTASGLLLGTGGISGTIGLESNGILYRDFGRFSAELNTFQLTFSRGSITESRISGTLTIPGFQHDGEPAKIGINAFIKENGDFFLSADGENGLASITWPDVFELHINTLAIGNQDDHYFLSLTGSLDFIADLPGLGRVLPKNIAIQKLIIWDDGRLEFSGGYLQVPKAFRLNIGPVKLEVTQLSLGAHTRKLNGIDRQYVFFGFDGMINTGRAGVNASGNGIKYYFTVDAGAGRPFDHFTSIDGIAIDITVPSNASRSNAAFLLSGYLSMKNPDPAVSGSAAGSEYTGSVTFTLPRLKLSGAAGMRLNPEIPAFIVDIGLDLSTPIPVAGTGLGIYGFRGIIGQHYMPAKSATNPPLNENATWWEYYKSRSRITNREGIELDKFASQPGFSLGAGMALATGFDGGFIFSSKLFLLLGLPDVFLIQGQAGILRSRLGLRSNVDPPFSALIVFGDNSVRGNLGVNYNLPDGGGILSMQGALDMAFFFNNASGWYLNVGKDSPENERVRARILSLFEGHAYLMLSSRGIRAGGGVRLDFNKKIGPVGVGFGAFLNLGGSVSFKPIQIGGYIQAGGYAYLKVWKFKFGLSLTLTLAVESPNPFNIIGSIQLKINLPWPFKDIKITLELSWRKNDNQQALLQPIPVLSLPDAAKGYTPAIANSILSNETFTLNYVTRENAENIPAPGTAGWRYNFLSAQDVKNVTIPLDSFIDIDLLKPVKPGNYLGGTNNQLPDGYTEILPPQRGVHDQVRHEFELAGLDIFIWRGDGTSGNWMPYNIYQAVSAIVKTAAENNLDLSTLYPGYWQFNEPNKYTKIRLMAQNMFSYTSQTVDTDYDLDARNFEPGDVFCYDRISKRYVVNWHQEDVGTTYSAGQNITYQELDFTFTGLSGTVFPDSTGTRSLVISGDAGQLLISLPEKVLKLSLMIGDNGREVNLSVGDTFYLPGIFGRSFRFNRELQNYRLGSDDENQNINYEGIGGPADKVLLSITQTLPDYEADWVIGGHFELDAKFAVPKLPAYYRYFERSRLLFLFSLYNGTTIWTPEFDPSSWFDEHVVARWPMETTLDSIAGIPGYFAGNTIMTGAFYQADENPNGVLHQGHIFTSNNDRFVIPYQPTLKLENGSFSMLINVQLKAYERGINTLGYKIATDEAGNKKGYAIHLCQHVQIETDGSYPASVNKPQYILWFTCYDGQNSSGLSTAIDYDYDCATGKIYPVQNIQVFLCVDRAQGRVNTFINGRLWNTQPIPQEFGVSKDRINTTTIREISYVTEGLQERLDENPRTEDGLINEVRLLSDGLNRTVQPVWRPNSTIAIRLKTLDRINGNVDANSTKYHIFGFRTAGPVGHFHQESTKYAELEKTDSTAAFKLASLKHYIDYERSYPDAQGRYDLSKPVFRENARFRLLFTQPYINAMFAGWNSYQGLPVVNTRLEIVLIDPSQKALTEEFRWNPVKEMLIDDSNFQTLPEDQRLIYLLNRAAQQGACNAMAMPMRKRLQEGGYQFPELTANTLYTAVVNAVYQPGGQAERKTEVHKFNFMSSRYRGLSEQAGSFVTVMEGSQIQHVVRRRVNFTDDYIENTLRKLLNNNTGDDPTATLRYAVPFERMLYGGLRLVDLEDASGTTLTLIVNATAADPQQRRILAIVISNPEPFNDPKIPETELRETVEITIRAGAQEFTPDKFVYLHARDTSGVLITNTAMNMPWGKLTFKIRYKPFNGIDYMTLSELYESPVIDLNVYA